MSTPSPWSGIKTFASIDVAKFVAALMVVAIHTQPLLGVNHLANQLMVGGLLRVAVPFFLVAAGFFFARGLLDSRTSGTDRLKKTLIRLLITYLLWSVIYLPLDLPRRIGPDWGSTAVGLVRYVVGFFTLGTHMQFWYFPALASSLVLLVLVRRWWSWGPVFALGIVLYAFGCLGDAYFQLSRVPVLSTLVDLWRQVFYSTRNLVLLSFLPVAAGAWMAAEYRPGRRSTPWVLAAVFLALSVAESWITEQAGLAIDHNGSVFLVPAVVALFAGLLETPLQETPFTRNLRDASVIVFCSHLLVTGVSGFIDLPGPAGGILGILAGPVAWPRWIQFLFTVGFTVGLSFLILRFKNPLTKRLY